MVQLKLKLNQEQKKKITEVITRVPRNEEEVKRIFYRLEDVLDFDDFSLFSLSFPSFLVRFMVFIFLCSL